jgi:hypothetical protein
MRQIANYIASVIPQFLHEKFRGLAVVRHSVSPPIARRKSRREAEARATSER